MVVQSPRDTISLPGLDAGEADAIALALELRAAEILMDDADGRDAAISLGLIPKGTLGLLQRAADTGMLDLLHALDRLQATNFRAPAGLLADMRAHELHRRKEG